MKKTVPTPKRRDVLAARATRWPKPRTKPLLRTPSVLGPVRSGRNKGNTPDVVDFVGHNRQRKQRVKS